MVRDPATSPLGVTGRLMARFGARPVLLAGLSMVALALWTLAGQSADAPYWPGRFFAYALLGLGAGNSFLPLLTLAMSEVPPRDAGLGSAIVNVSLQLAAAFGLAVLGSVASQRTDALLLGHVAARDAVVGGYRFAYSVAVGGILVGLALAAIVLRPQSKPVSAGS